MLDTVAKLRIALKKTLTNTDEHITSEEFRAFGSLVLAFLEKQEEKMEMQARVIAMLVERAGLVPTEAPAVEKSAPVPEDNTPPPNFPAGFAATPGGPIAGAAPATADAPAAPPVVEGEPDIITKDNLPKPDVSTTRAANVHPIPKAPAGKKVHA